MKKSLLGLTLVSLVALVGCNSTPAKPKAKAVLEDFFTLSFGKDSLKYAEIEEITAGSEYDEYGWYEEDAKNQYIGGLAFTLNEGTTLEDCYNEILVGSTETPADVADFEAKYEEQMLLDPSFNLAATYFSAEYAIGSYVKKGDDITGVKFVDLFLQGSIVPANESSDSDMLVIIAAGWYYEMAF